MQAFDPFDNPHPATPDLPDDDRMGIRLSSAAQRLIKIDPSNADPNIDWWIRAQWDNPRVTYLTLAGIMLVTERPQLVHLDNPATAHAVDRLWCRGRPAHPHRRSKPPGTRTAADIRSSRDSVCQLPDRNDGRQQPRQLQSRLLPT